MELITRTVPTETIGFRVRKAAAQKLREYAAAHKVAFSDVVLSALVEAGVLTKEDVLATA